MSLHDHDHDAFQHDPTNTNNRHSIDFSLELEHQLEAESLPNSPAHPEFGRGTQSIVDPAILESLVKQLRLSSEQAERERDELAAQLAETKSREASLKDTVASVSERCERLESELAAARAQNQADQDQLTLLRGNIEDSRRALMRLQKESRRMSQVSNLDLSQAGPSLLGGPPSSRRSSFVPLTGTPAGRVNAHRRISSVSEPGTLYADSLISPPVRSPQFEQLNGGIPASSGSNSRRISGFFGRATPPDLPPALDATEVEELRKELQAIKEQLEETRHELTEAREAQEASETCANALRTFISENSIGMQPPGRNTQTLPPSTEEASGRNSISSRWGFKLWNNPAAATSTPSSSPALPPAQPANTTPTPPLTRKLGGFFSGRASISSQSSITRAEPHSHQQEPMFNGSDSSSLDSGTEPVSPASELPPTRVLVHSDDVAVVPGLTRSPEQTKSMLPPSDLIARLE